MALFGGPKPIGLALGGGAARGFAHIGVLKALEAEGIKPAAVAGTSMGAIVGAFYAAGYTPDEMARIALEMDPRVIGRFDQVAFREGAALSGRSAEEMLRTYLPATFEELKLPFGCTATDLSRNEGVWFTSGDLVTAVRASMSIPVVFTPVLLDGMFLVDGFLADPVPVELVRSLGGSSIVAVEVTGSGTVNPTDAPSRMRPVHGLRAVMQGEAPRGASAFDIISASSEALEQRLTRFVVASADVVISPEVHTVTSFEFSRTAEIIEAGELAARASIDAIRRRARLRNSPA